MTTRAKPGRPSDAGEQARWEACYRKLAFALLFISGSAVKTLLTASS